MKKKESILELIDKSWTNIYNVLQIPKKKRDSILSKLPSQNDSIIDEEVWTFLMACGYTFVGDKGAHKLAKILCGNHILGHMPSNNYIWLECQPISPRSYRRGYSEGNTQIDLAMGFISRRQRHGTDTTSESGIEYLPSPGDQSKNWVCLAEAKLMSDIQTHTTYDPHRNQLARIIEVALTFQKYGGCDLPGQLYVTLITPKIFRDGDRKSRLYFYKFNEYSQNAQAILDDINTCKIPRRNDDSWEYPSIEERLNNLRMIWVSFEELIENMPESMLRETITEIWAQTKRKHNLEE